MTRDQEMAALSQELAGIAQELTEIQRQLDRLNRRLPTGGVLQKHRAMKWLQKAYPLINRGKELQERMVPIQKRLAILLGEEGISFPFTIEDIEQVVQATDATLRVLSPFAKGRC